MYAVARTHGATSCDDYCTGDLGDLHASPFEDLAKFPVGHRALSLKDMFMRSRHRKGRFMQILFEKGVALEGEAYE